MSSNSFRSRFTNSLALILAAVAGLLYFFRRAFVGPESMDTTVGLLTPAMVLMMSFAVFILNYLRTGSFFGNDSNESDSSLMKEEFSLLRRELEERKKNEKYQEHLNSELQELKTKVLNRNYENEILSNEEKEELVASIKDSIVRESSNNLIEQLESKYREEVKREYYLSHMREQCEQVKLRLEREIAALGRRGNLNLVIGVLTTLAAVTILATTVLEGNQTLVGKDLIAYYTPRLTLSIFIEIFSFFFLKLYKTGLSEIKYFQNELTNVELKFIALEKAHMVNDEESMKLVIEDLVSTERNFKIAKGESTVELEKFRTDQSNNQKIMDSLLGLIQSKK
ncbi:hypothetical protein [Vibrio parahaemolyticus]|uniref:hypothetical protein n=1 Tax=Vibrio parahaemolyticus TaxID=670 RepID=UPI00235E3B3E|nr:hypothetical protein [Vibrio parahaemolyticus]